MTNAGTSRSEPLDSSACHVCQGIGDLKNPRGFVSDSEDFFGQRVSTYYYVHHPNVRALVNSGEAGCYTCALLSVKLKGHAAWNLDRAFLTSPSACKTSRKDSTSTACIAQSQNDLLAATQLAKLAKTKDLGELKGPDLGIHGHGRIWLQFECKEKTGPRGSKGHNKAKIFVLGNEFRNEFGIGFDYFNSIGL